MYKLSERKKIFIFCLPAHKVLENNLNGPINKFLAEHFNGFMLEHLMPGSTHFGLFERLKTGNRTKIYYIAYKISYEDDRSIELLENFLCRIAEEMNEEEIWRIKGEGAWLSRKKREDKF